MFLDGPSDDDNNNKLYLHLINHSYKVHQVQIIGNISKANNKKLHIF